MRGKIIGALGWALLALVLSSLPISPIRILGGGWLFILLFSLIVGIVGFFITSWKNNPSFVPRDW